MSEMNLHNVESVVHQQNGDSEMLKSKPRGRRRRKASSPASDSGTVRSGTYSRFSSDRQRDESIVDQQRRCREAAQSNGHSILPDLEFMDEAVSGTKASRDGLLAMLNAAERGELDVLYVYSLSRLARESVITMPMLKKLVHTYCVRVICVGEGLDSDRNGWELMAAIFAVLHENFIRELSENVRKGQEGIVLAGLAVGDHCFGYRTEPVPGSEKTRRNARPRKTYAIDAATAEWVDKIFRWFVEERQTIRWIVRKLNREKAPKDHRATKKEWNHTQVVGVLSNEKYVGIWPWGRAKNVRDPFTGKISQEARADEECEKWTRHLQHLQFIDDHTFELAQQRLHENEEALAEHRSADGKLRGSSKGRKGSGPSHLLEGAVKCAACADEGHDTNFQVGGAGGRYLVCPRYLRGTCGCRTQLQRERAERMILDEIGRRILDNESWVRAVHVEMLECWRIRQQRIPAELAALDNRISDIDRKIEKLLDRIEAGDESPEIANRLADRREERRSMLQDRTSLQRENAGEIPEPTEDWVNARLSELGTVLHASAPASAEALQRLIGGKLLVEEIRREGRQRHFLRGRFTISAASLSDVLAGSRVSETNSPDSIESTEEIVIDFVDPDPTEQQSELAKSLQDQGLLSVEIARELDVSKARVTALIRRWYESRGLQMPDGRKRRGQLARKHQEAPLYQQIADSVKKRLDDGLLIGEIADDLGVDRNTVTAAIRYWYKSRDLPVPDGRSRRATLKRKCRDKPDEAA